MGHKSAQSHAGARALEMTSSGLSPSSANCLLTLSWLKSMPFIISIIWGDMTFCRHRHKGMGAGVHNGITTRCACCEGGKVLARRDECFCIGWHFPRSLRNIKQ